MIGSLFILNDKGSVLFEKHYRRVSSRACCDDFWKMIERKAGQQVRSHAAPVLPRAADLFFSCRPSSRKALSRTQPPPLFISSFSTNLFFCRGSLPLTLWCGLEVGRLPAKAQQLSRQ